MGHIRFTSLNKPGSGITSVRFAVYTLVCVMNCVNPAYADNYPSAGEIEQIRANWKCEWCPTNDSTVSYGEVEAGPGYVTNDSYKHGNYSGVDEEGLFLSADGEHHYRNPKGEFTNVNVENAGLDSRSLSAEGGRQGNYAISADYREIPRLYLDTARTPYSGSSNLQLNGGGAFGPDTSAMPQLANQLTETKIGTQRKTVAIEGIYQQTNDLSYTVRFRRQTKEGDRTAGLALGDSFILARSAIVALPVDFVTDNAEFEADYRQPRWQGQIRYQYSSFKNNNDSVKWDNVFTEPAGVSDGQASLEPDNTMQQVSFSGGYQVNTSMTANAFISAGRMEQNDDFLPYTINGSLSPGNLPRDSLNGKINTFDTSVNLLSSVGEKTTLKAQYRQHEQDNDTPRASYIYVTGDTSLAASARANFPYSFRKRVLTLDGQYEFKRDRQLSAGYEREQIDRTYQEVEETRENTYWLKFRNRPSHSIDYSVRLATAERDGSQYEPQSEISSPENVLLRKYNLADRSQDKAGFNFMYTASEMLQLGFYTDYTKDDYTKSEIGLTESTSSSYAFDVSFQMTSAVRITLDYTLTKINSDQSGSQSYSSADWTAKNDDQIKITHAALDYVIRENKIIAGLDYTYAESSSEIKVAPGQSFPELRSRRQTLSVYGDYFFDKRSALRVLFRYEDYLEKNWAVDNVQPDSIANVLTLGELSPDYNIGVLVVSYRLKFE